MTAAAELEQSCREASSEIAKRGARLRADRAIREARVIAGVVVFSQLLWWGSVVVGTAVVFPTGAGGGAFEDVLRVLCSVAVMTAIRPVAVLTVIMIVAPMFTRSLVDLRLRTLTRAQLCTIRRERRRTRIKRRRLLLVVVGVLAVLISAMLVLNTRLTLLMLLVQTPLAGGVVMASGLCGWSGRRLCCAGCGYAMGSWAGAGEVCPECSRRWKLPWHARAGSRRWSRGVVAVGLGLYLLSLLGMFVTVGAALR